MRKAEESRSERSELAFSLCFSQHEDLEREKKRVWGKRRENQKFKSFQQFFNTMFKQFLAKIRSSKKDQEGLERAIAEGLITEEEKLKIEIERATKKLLAFEKAKEKKIKKK